MFVKLQAAFGLAMSHKCCVPGCHGNYETSSKKVSVFKFPEDEELKSMGAGDSSKKPGSIDAYQGENSHIFSHFFLIIEFISLNFTLTWQRRRQAQASSRF